MPPWVMEILIPGGFLAMMAGGAKAWWNAWRDDRKEKAKAIADAKEKEEKRRQDEMDRLRAELREARALVEKGQERFESLLMDAAAKGQDDKREKAELIALLSKFHELSSVMIKALEDATKARAKDAP